MRRSHSSHSHTLSHPKVQFSTQAIHEPSSEDTTNLNDEVAVTAERSRAPSVKSSCSDLANVFRKVFLSLDLPTSKSRSVSKMTPREVAQQRPQSRAWLPQVVAEQLLSPDMDEWLVAKFGSRRLTYHLGPFDFDSDLLISEFTRSNSMSTTSEATTGTLSRRSLHSIGSSSQAMGDRSGDLGTGAVIQWLPQMEGAPHFQEPGFHVDSDDREALLSWGRFQLLDSKESRLRQPQGTIAKEERGYESDEEQDADEDLLSDERTQRTHMEVARGKGGIFTRSHYHRKPMLECIRADLQHADLVLLLWMNADHKEPGDTMQGAPLSFALDVSNLGIRYRQRSDNEGELGMSPQWSMLVEAILACKPVLVLYEGEEDEHLWVLEQLERKYERLLLYRTWSNLLQVLSDSTSTIALSSSSSIQDYMEFQNTDMELRVPADILKLFGSTSPR